MNKIEELLEKLCPNGVEYRELGEVFIIKNGYTPSKNNDEYWIGGSIPWFRMEDIRTNGKILKDSIQHITPKAIKGKLFPKNSLIVATTATIGVHALITEDFLCNQQLTAITINSEYEQKINIKYCFYYFDLIDKECIRIKNKGGGISIVTLDKMKKIKIPVPPLEIQSEIVYILDKFTALLAELKAELKARKKQYAYYRDKLFEFSKNIEYLPLEKIAEIGTGSSNANEAIENGIYPFFVRSQQLYRKNTFEFDETAIITSGDGVGVGKIFHYIEGKYALHQRAYRIHIISPRVIPKYFYYYMKEKFYDYIMKNAFNSSVTSIRKPMLNSFLVPIIEKSEQEKIISILDNFDKLINDLCEGIPAEIEARQKQYEYYRDKLLTFKELEK